MSAHTLTLASIIYGTGLLSGLVLITLPPTVTAAALVVVAVAIGIATRKHLSRWP